MKQPIYKRGTYQKLQEKKKQFRVYLTQKETELTINFIKSLRNENANS